MNVRESLLPRSGGPSGWVLAGWACAFLLAGNSQAEVVQVYSFEIDEDGFTANGGGVEVIQDTIGATDGEHSLKIDILAPATFVGALTTLLPAEIGDPPGLDFVIFDLTITQAFPAEGFVRAGITVFGASQPDHPNGQQFGLQAQFLANEFELSDLAPGTHEVRINLASALHPLTFSIGSFNDIFGELGSDVNDLLPSGFQIYINKSNFAPWTGYVDNIRAGRFDADFNDDGAVNASDFSQWIGHFGTNDPGSDADGDGDSDGVDFLVWQRQLGMDSTLASAAVPEPSWRMFALITTALSMKAGRRGRWQLPTSLQT